MRARRTRERGGGGERRPTCSKETLKPTSASSVMCCASDSVCGTARQHARVRQEAVRVGEEETKGEERRSRGGEEGRRGMHTPVMQLRICATVKCPMECSPKYSG